MKSSDRPHLLLVNTSTKERPSIFSYLLRVLGDCYAHSLFEEILRTRSNGISKPLLSKIILLRKMQDSRLRKLRYLGPVYANGKMYFATPFGEGVSSSLRNINDAISILSRNIWSPFLLLSQYSQLLLPFQLSIRDDISVLVF